MNRQPMVAATADDLRKLERKGSNQRLVRDETVYRIGRDRDAELRRAIERSRPDPAPKPRPGR